MDTFNKDISLGEPSPSELLKGHLGKLHVPSLDKLSHSCGIEIAGLPQYFREKTRQAFQEIERRTFASNNEWFNHFNFLYQTWLATRDVPGIDLLPNFAESLSSYDSFIRTYGQDTSLSQRSEFIFWVKWFTQRIVHPERIIKLHPPMSKDYNTTRRGIYEYKGKWHSIPSNDGENTFVEEDVIREVNTLTDTLDSPEADLFHTTGSAALSGISQHKALLSARESEKQANSVKTGEYIHHKDEQLSLRGTNALEDVYASSMVDDTCSEIRWFDEYPVVFGFQSDEIEKYLREQYGRKSASLRGVSADGHRLGKTVSLSLVRAVYTYRPYLEILRLWAEQNVPGSHVISIEAGSLLRTRSDEKTTLYKNYPYRFGEPVITDWQALLNEPAIILQ